jgi:hypothetical protein
MKPFVAALTLLFCAPLASATDASISIAPAVITLRGALGQGTTQEVSVVNQTDRELTFEMVAYDVIIRDGKRTFVKPGELAGSIAATAIFSRPAVRVAPGESATVTVTVTLPPNAVHRAAVIVFNGQTEFQTKNAAVLASIGTLLTFQVSDEVTVVAAEPVITPQTASQNVRVTQRCMNSGGEPAIMKGTAAVLDASGNLVARVDLEPRRLLPGEGADMTAELPEELPRGNYRVLVTLQENQKTTTRGAALEIP